MMTNEQLLLEANKIKDATLRLEFLGRCFGYPECCIDFFITNKKPSWLKDLPWYEKRTLKLNGYVPCEKCSKLSRQELVDDIDSRRKVKKII